MNDPAVPVPRQAFHRVEAPVTPEIEAVLARYLEIQRQDQELQSEKARLADALGQYLAQQPDGVWYPEVGGVPLKVRHVRETLVEYDEGELRRRLTDRYVRLLVPDLRKMRQHLAEIEPYLAPILELVGTPDRERVRAAVESGVVRAEEFAGAFRKRVRTRVAVMRVQPHEPQSAPEPGAGPN